MTLSAWLALALALISTLSFGIACAAWCIARDAEEIARASAERLRFLEKWDPPQGRPAP